MDGIREENEANFTSKAIRLKPSLSLGVPSLRKSSSSLSLSLLLFFLLLLPVFVKYFLVRERESVRDGLWGTSLFDSPPLYFLFILIIVFALFVKF